MSLQRRLMIYLLVCAPLVWAVAMAVSLDRTRHEVNELFDTELIRLARQVQATMVPALPREGVELPAVPRGAKGAIGDADLSDLAVAVWNSAGQLLISDREGVKLPYRANAVGFVDETLGGESWRIYYLQSFTGESLVAAGQAADERDEVVFALVASQVVPWLLVLPVLMLAMAWSVRKALAPIHQLTAELHGRDAGNLSPMADDRVPTELKPLVSGMNGLFARIDDLRTRERRFTADAAHELRTPLAVLRAQWDVVKRSDGEDERASAQARLDAGIERMDRLVTQMLALSRAESASALPSAAPLQWPVLVEQAMGDCLALAHRRNIELACEWPAGETAPLPIPGDPHLMAVLLRNLLDNAVRYADSPSTVTLRFTGDSLQVENDGPVLSPEIMATLGQRFHRPAGQQESGSGLGISIVERIAHLHGLELGFEAGPGGRGLIAIVKRAKPRA